MDKKANTKTKNKSTKTQIQMATYARRLGISKVSVHDAIKTGRLVKGYDPVTKKIIPDIADKEWGLAAKQRSEKQLRERALTQADIDQFANVPVYDIVITPADDLAEADRKRTIIKAQQDLLALKKEAGELVNREEMYREMFEFGKEIRTALQAIPARVVDRLINMDRMAATKLLTEEINQVLEKLSESDEEGN